MISAKKLFSPAYAVKAVKHLFREGPRSFARTSIERLSRYDIRYEKWLKYHTISDEELQMQKMYKFSYIPKISVIVPVYNTPQKFLEEMIQSLQEQTYSNWELCLADGASSQENVVTTIKKYQENDNRIKLVELDENLKIAGNTNAALKLATGEYTALLDHDDLLAPNALFEVVSALQETRYDVIYTDEDIVTHDLKHHIAPVLKPDFSPQLICCHNYITHLFVTRTELLHKIGGFSSQHDGSQDYDVVLKCCEHACGDEGSGIKHIHKILYHWRSHKGSVAGDSANKMYAYDAGKKAIEDHFTRCGVSANVEHMEQLGYYHPIYEPVGNPKVSIIIPNMDHVEDLEKCINSLYKVNTYKNFEVVIAENNSRDNSTFEYYKKLQSEHDDIKIVKYEGEFNFSAINNLAVKSADGQYLLFLNNDTELITSDGLSEMLGLCTQPEVGIVGAKLLYADNKVQHAGVVVGFGGFAGHVFHNFSNTDPGYNMRPMLNCNYSVVTGACLMVSRQDFDAVEGFCEKFKVGINDVDFCLKVRKLGKYVVYNAFSQWHHYESKSRGIDEEDPQKAARLQSEINLFQKRWPDILRDGDPFYNNNFDVGYDAFKLNPVPSNK